MKNDNFKDIILSQKEGREIEEWEGTVLDYLYKVKESPEICSFAPGRIYNTIINHGTTELDSSFKTRGYEDILLYDFFRDKIYGTYESIHDIVSFLRAAARRTETGKRILILVGPVSSGKSTISSLIKRGLEEDKGLKYAIKGCPIREEPLHVIPYSDREYWEEQLNVKIEGTVCPVCQQMIDNNFTSNGVVSWEDIPVVTTTFSEQKRYGIGTFSPSDPKCVKYDTLLFCDKGMVSFEELQGEVNSLEGEFKDFEITIDSVDGYRRTSKFFNNGLQSVYKVVTKFGYEIECTDVHPLLTNSGWKTVPDIEVGDVVAIKRNSQMFGDNDKLDDFYCDFIDDESALVFTIPSTMTPRLAKIIGYLTSNGSIDESGIYFMEIDSDIMDDFVNSFESIFSVRPEIDEERGGTLASLSSSVIASFFLNTLGVKTDVYSRSIPLCIRKASRENVISFLRGLLLTNGEYEYVAVSEKLAKQIHLMLLNLGIIADLDTSNSPYYSICTNTNLLDEISLIEESHENIIWFPVVRKVYTGKYNVYDLTVPETHSFCANGFVNHNSQDVSELIGRSNMAKLNRYGETDPRAYDFNGELQVANRGIIELIEILKVDVKLQYVLISLAQEQLIKSPGFPQMYIDTLIIGHTNQSEYDSFKADKKNEALHDRMYPIYVPWNLRVDDEVKIYEKMIRESDFRNIHIAPNTLKIAAEFAVLSRLKPSKKVSNLIEKMKIYNGEITEEFKKSEIDVKTLRQEGRDESEGMTGISPRFIINALNVALGKKEDKNCINPIDVIRTLRENFRHHIGISDEDKKTYLNLLVGDKNSVNSEFKEVALKTVNMAFIYAYEDQAGALFKRYMENISAFCKKDKILDTVTGEYSDPDEKLMRSLEELIGVPVNSKSEFRNNIFVYKADCLERGTEFSYDDYKPLKDAIEKKLMSDLKSVVNLSIADTTTTSPKAKRRREKAMEILLENGHCESCANTLLAYVGEILRKGNS